MAPLVNLVVYAYGYMFGHLESLAPSCVDKQQRTGRIFIDVCTLIYCTFTQTAFYLTALDYHTLVARLTS
jgi:hypothetical protein